MRVERVAQLRGRGLELLREDDLLLAAQRARAADLLEVGLERPALAPGSSSSAATARAGAARGAERSRRRSRSEWSLRASLTLPSISRCDSEYRVGYRPGPSGFNAWYADSPPSWALAGVGRALRPRPATVQPIRWEVSAGTVAGRGRVRGATKRPRILRSREAKLPVLFREFFAASSQPLRAATLAECLQIGLKYRPVSCTPYRPSRGQPALRSIAPLPLRRDPPAAFRDPHHRSRVSGSSASPRECAAGGPGRARAGGDFRKTLPTMGSTPEGEIRASSAFSEKSFYLSEFRGRTLAIAVPAADLGAPGAARIGAEGARARAAAGWS